MSELYRRLWRGCGIKNLKNFFVRNLDLRVSTEEIFVSKIFVRKIRNAAQVFAPFYSSRNKNIVTRTYVSFALR